MKRKICVVTTTRADYGPLKCLIEDIESDGELHLQLIVTGTHLSAEFGLTVKEIELSGIPITKKINFLLSSDDSVSICKGMGLALISFSEVYEQLQPDVVVVLGDRYELQPIVSAANIFRIPVAHISGGEITEGVLDDSIRHSITKLSQLHFTSIERYRKRVIQMGEQPNHVFNVGEPGIENILRMELLNKQAFERLIGHALEEKNLLVTYHPETTESLEKIENDFQVLLQSLNNLKDTFIIFTKSNADAGGRLINHMIDEYVQEHGSKSVSFTSMGQLGFLSALLHVDAIVGNSSSGIWEAPSFELATINIGNRQKGRIKAESTIDVEATDEALKCAFERIYEPAFKSKLKKIINPYGDGKTSLKIIEKLKTVKLEKLCKKVFFDLG